MTKTEFQDLLHRYSSSTRTEAEKILILEKQYPYSQLLHSLAARLSKDHSFSNQQTELQLAAVYSADRHVLKEIMSKSMSLLVDEGNKLTVDVNSAIDSIDYADEVMHDLERLHELKHNFEMTFVDLPKQEIKRVMEIKSEVPVDEPKPVRKPPVPPKRIAGEKSKAQRIKEIVKARNLSLVKPVEPSKISSSKHKSDQTGKQKDQKHGTHNIGKKRTSSGDDLIAEIETSKKKLKPEGKKQREQIQIIDQFIKAQPSISSPKDKAATSQGDLAGLKQGEFGDQIISETLVKILVNQGKKDKAIDVLKKLIWKFPQKKAYFAAQIEELKK